MWVAKDWMKAFIPHSHMGTQLLSVLATGILEDHKPLKYQTSNLMALCHMSSCIV